MIVNAVFRGNVNDHENRRREIVFELILLQDVSQPLEQNK